MGKTGAGKSTLINAILDEDLAPTGTGQAVTKENALYSKTMLLPPGSSNETTEVYARVGKRVNLYDTVGLEVDSKITKETLNNIKDFLIKAEHNKKDKDITIVWFCVNYRSSRFESYELELIKELSIEYEIPFIIVMTQCYTDEKGELEKQIESDLPEVTVMRVLAKDYRLRSGSINAFGVQELIRKSVIDYSTNKVRILESKLEKLSFDREVHIKKIKSKGMECINKHVKKAMCVALIPTMCIPIVHGMCIKMLMDLNKIVGINSTKNFVSEIFSDAIVGVIVTPFMGIPVISVGAAYAYVETVGEAYLNSLMAIIESSTNAELKDNELMSKRICEELKKHKK